MNLQQPLTKENFWNDMQQKYPNAMRVFCAWIDEYKKAVDWNWLFGNDVKHRKRWTKFHDLPHAMQLGIWFEFVSQQGGCQWNIDDMFQYDLREDIEGYFREVLEFDAAEEAREE